MKKFALILSVLNVLSIVLSACGTTATPAPAEKFRVAVVMPSAINDLAFSQSMYDALTRIQTEMGGPDAFELVYSDGMSWWTMPRLQSATMPHRASTW